MKRRRSRPTEVADAQPPAVPAAVSGSPWRVPFNRAFETGFELDFVRQAMAGEHISGGGPFTVRVESLLETILGPGSRVLLTTSCTHALELAALLLEVEPGDEVILPSFTFVSVANAFVLRGARPVFVDCRPDTLNLDERLVEALVRSRTKAIVAVHYGGVGCDMAVLGAIGETDRANLAKYLTIAKLRLENAIIVVRSGRVLEH